MKPTSSVIQHNKAKIWQIAFFSLNNTSTNLFLAMMGYISYYANGIAGLSVIAISFILTGMRIFDGFTDPIIGFVIDKSDGRLGKFRPFMIIGYVLMALSSLVLFFTTHLVPSILRIPYFIVVYSVYIIGYTFQTAVVKSGQSVITNDMAQRPLITFFDSAFIMFAHGLTAFYVSVYLIHKYTDFNNPALFAEFVLSVIVLSGICTIFAVIGIWEKDNRKFFNLSILETENKIRFRDYFDILRHNKPIKLLVIAASANKFASMVYGNTTVLVMLYGILMNNYPLAGIIGIITGLPNMLMISLGIHSAKKHGQRHALILSTYLCIIFQLIMLYLMVFYDLRNVSLTSINAITIVFLAVFALLNGCKSITNNMVVPMIADCTDYEYARSGKFVPGLMGALFSFIDKVISSLGTAFVGVILAAAGYAKAFPQITDSLTATLKYLTIFFYCIVPIAGWIITLIAMRFYGLDAKEMTKLYISPSDKS